MMGDYVKIALAVILAGWVVGVPLVWLLTIPTPESRSHGDDDE